jgi:hypothetical protein
MSATERLARVLELSKKHFGPDVGRMIDSMLTPLNLEIMVGTLALWAGSHLFGVGEIIDVLLLLVGAFTIGWSIVDVGRALYDFADYTINGTTDDDLERAAAAFANAVVVGGITVIMAILLHKSVKEIQVTRGASVADAIRPRNPGLPKVGPDPYAGQIWSKPGILKDPLLKAGEGETSWFGEVRYSPHGTVAEQVIARIHELGHRFLTPRFIALRTLRVQLRASGYLKSALLRYLEEAMTETVAQVWRLGLSKSTLFQGVTFPVREGYVTINSVMGEGAVIGRITAGTRFFIVQFTPAPPKKR